MKIHLIDKRVINIEDSTNAEDLMFTEARFISVKQINVTKDSNNRFVVNEPKSIIINVNHIVTIE